VRAEAQLPSRQHAPPRSATPATPRDRSSSALSPTLPAVQVPIPHGAHALAKLSDVRPALAPALRWLTSPHRLDQFVCSLADSVNEVALGVQFRLFHGKTVCTACAAVASDSGPSFWFAPTRLDKQSASLVPHALIGACFHGSLSPPEREHRDAIWGHVSASRVWSAEEPAACVVLVRR